MPTLCVDLQAILDLELGLGNEIAYVAEPAGTACPYAVSLKQPLHHEVIRERGLLPPWIKAWTNTDTHYELESGYACEKTRHSIAGPIR
jgi:hypothetical protein